MRFFYLFIIFFAYNIQSLFAETVAEEPTDTDGNGYINISTLAHLRWLSETEEAWSGKYELDNDIDASETRTWNVGDHDDDVITPDSAMGWKPIGEYHYEDYSNYFMGEVNGNGHIISNLFINRPRETCGFFRSLHDAKIENFNLSNFEIMNSQLSALLAVILGKASIKGCNVQGKIVANEAAGMIATVFLKYAEGTTIEIDSCIADVDIYGNGAGFIGGGEGLFNSSVNISNCISKGSINGEIGVGFMYNLMDRGNAPGGLIKVNNCISESNLNVNKYATGFMHGCSASFNTKHIYINCKSRSKINPKALRGYGFTSSLTGNITLQCCSREGDVFGKEIAYGFCRQFKIYSGDFRIENCIVNGDVESDGIASGFVKEVVCYGDADAYLGIKQCAVVGNVIAKENAVGFSNLLDLGYSNYDSDTHNVKIEIEDCYFAGEVSGDGNLSAFIYSTDIEDEVEFTAKNCYWDKEKTDVENSVIGVGVTKAELQDLSNFSNSLDKKLVFDPEQNDGYPYPCGYTVVGIEDDEEYFTEENNYTLYPNPAREIINLKTKNAYAGEVKIYIVDLLGNRELLYSGLLDDKHLNNIDVSQKQAGNYYLLIEGKKEKTALPLVIE